MTVPVLAGWPVAYPVAAATEINFTFSYETGANVMVLYRDRDTGLDTPLAYGVDYTVAPAGGSPTGGTVTIITAPAGGTDTEAWVYRWDDAEQPAATPKFPVYEAALDRLARRVQELQEKLERALYLPVGSASGALPSADVLAGKTVKWDDDGNLVISIGDPDEAQSDSSASAAAAAAAAAASAAAAAASAAALAEINELYLGAFPAAAAAEASVSPDPVPAGAFYTNTTTGDIHLWTGSEWISMSYGPTEKGAKIKLAGDVSLGNATEDTLDFNFTPGSPEYDTGNFVQGTNTQGFEIEEDGRYHIVWKVDVDDYGEDIAFKINKNGVEVAGFKSNKPLAVDTIVGSARLINIQTITASGVYTPTAGTAKCDVIIQGGGGGGGGVSSSTATAAAAGGRCGETGFKFGIDVAAISGATITIGAGGAGGVAGASGASGGDTSLVGSGLTLTALGGPGGIQGAGYIAAYAAGSHAPAGSGCDFYRARIIGGRAVMDPLGSNPQGGDGSNSYFSGAGTGGFVNTGATAANGASAIANSGAGGGGAAKKTSTASTANGGDGGSGVVYIFEYSDPSIVEPVEKSGAYTLALGDQEKIIYADDASAFAVTIPAEASVDFAVGSVITIIAAGTGAISVTADAGVDLNDVTTGSCTISAQWDEVRLRKRASDSWVITGDHGGVI